MSARVQAACGERAGPLRRVAQRRRREYHTEQQINAVFEREQSLYRLKDSTSQQPHAAPRERAPIGLACSRCTPDSRESWKDIGSSLHHRQSQVVNILDVGRQSYSNGGVVSKYLCDVVQACRLKKYEYPQVADMVLSDEAMHRVIEQATQDEVVKLDVNRNSESAAHSYRLRELEYAAARKKVIARAKAILDNMKSAISDRLLRLISWIMHKLLPRIAPGGAVARRAAIARLQRVASSRTPLILVPLHRSHLDYILVSLVLLNSDVRAPLVAAGDNMRIPFFGWLLRGLGAFYIRRRVEISPNRPKDEIYSNILRTYLMKSLQAGHNVEFFIEGGRTRTGKPQLPKAGILSVIIDAYQEGLIEDALLVPVSMNYEKLVDGNFVREQLGMPKEMETFWSALKGIWHVINSNYGGIRVDFNQPYSLKELMTSFQRHGAIKAATSSPYLPAVGNALTAGNIQSALMHDLDSRMLSNYSNSSLYGAEVSEEQKMTIEAIARHIVYDASQTTAAMCTNVVSYVLLTEARTGCGLQELCAGAEQLCCDLRTEGRDLGFAGDIVNVVRHAIDLLGNGLIRREYADGKVLLRPVATIPSLIELSYYANTLVAHYAAPAIVVTALEQLIVNENMQNEENGNVDSSKESIRIRHKDLLETSMQLSEIMSQEFILCAPCKRIEDLMSDTIDSLVSKEILCNVGQMGGNDEERWSQRFARTLDDDEELECLVDRSYNVKYKVGTHPSSLRERRRLQATLRPLIEAYSATADWLLSAADQASATPEHEAHQLILQDMTRRLESNVLLYGEALSTDAIRNCLRLVKQWGVVDIYTENRKRMITINKCYNTREKITAVCNTITRFRTDSVIHSVQDIV